MGYREASEFDGSCGGEQIQQAIDAAADEPGGAVVLVGPTGPDEGGRWDVAEAIEIPSHTTLVLSGAHLRLVDGANDNVVRNRNLEAGDEQVHLVGIGEARIDGNAANQERDWDTLWLSYGVHFFGVDGLSIRGVTIGPTNCWALTLEDVRDVRVSDVEFAQDGRTGNQDGIHVLGPAHRVTVNGLTGVTGDDVFAVASTESDPCGRGTDGPISAVAVSNVAVHNIHSTGLFRTIADQEAPLQGIHASNLAMTGGTDVGDAVLKIGWAGDGTEVMPRPEHHRDITVENVHVEEWDGPYCAVETAVGNLTLRGLRGRHTGPLFYNMENDLDGVLLDDCRTTLVGDPPETLVSDYHERLLTGGGGHNVTYRGTVRERPPGAVTLDESRCTDVRITNSAFDVDVSDPSATVGLRVYDDTVVEGLTLRDTHFDGFGEGVRVEAGATVPVLSASGVTHTAVSTPWALEPSVRVSGSGNSPPCPVFDTTVALEAGERSRVRVPDLDPATLVDCEVRLVPQSPAGTAHGYRLDGVESDATGLAIAVTETVGDDGGEVRLCVLGS